MNKKQFALLLQTLVLSTVASINASATDDEPAITEEEGRVLLGITLRKKLKELVAETAGCEDEDVIIEQAVAKKKAVDAS